VKRIKQVTGIQTLGGDYHKCESTFRPRTTGSGREDASDNRLRPIKSKQKQRTKSKK
jgi:hypothetical protein